MGKKTVKAPAKAVRKDAAPVVTRKDLAPSREFNMDGWINILSGLGVMGRDKLTGGAIEWTKPERRQMSQLYAADDMAQKIVDCLPTEALAQGFDWLNVTPKQDRQLWDEWSRLKVMKKYREGWSWSRVHGGGGLFMVVEDGGLDLSEPLNLERLVAIKSLIYFSRWELSVDSMDDDLSSPTFGEPLTYRLTPTAHMAANNLAVVHASRFILLPGAPLPGDERRQNDCWDDSVLTRAWNCIRNFNLGFDSAATAMQDFRVQIFKLQNLAQLVGADQDEAVRDRLKAVEFAKSVLRAVVIDAEEEYTSQETSFTGVEGLLEKLVVRMVAAADGLPRTKLFGEQGTVGLGGNGANEANNWNRKVQGAQKDVVEPSFMRLAEVIAAAKQGPFASKLPDGFGIEFAPLGQPSEKEVADTRKVQADTDKAYFDMGVLTSTEVRLSRFGGAAYSFETKLMDSGAGELTPDDDEPPEDLTPGVDE